MAGTFPRAARAGGRRRGTGVTRRHSISWPIWLAVAGLCAATAGCARRDETSAPARASEAVPANQQQGPEIEFGSDPNPPGSGANHVIVTVKDAAGSPVTDATVTVVFSMPAMPSMNMPPMRSAATLIHESRGRYRGTGELPMGGTWNVVVTVMRDSQEIGSRTFSVVAK
jgi:YtkA-like